MQEMTGVTAVSIDICNRDTSETYQEALGELILFLLERSYQVFLWSSTKDDDLSKENYDHQQIIILDGAPPFSNYIETKYPIISGKNTAWITEYAPAQKAARSIGAPYFYTSGQKSTPGGIKIGSLGEITLYLNPLTKLLREIESAIRAKQDARAYAPVIVGIGGPPQSGYQQFSLDIKQFFEADGHELVELLNLNPLVAHADQDAPIRDDSPFWVHEGAREWVVSELFEPLTSGKRFYQEGMPQGFPAEFEGHFPLFISEESILLVMSEMLFTLPLPEYFDLKILLDVSPAESTRRLYDMPMDDSIDSKFVEQYFLHEGKRYRDYLITNAVEQSVDFYIDANSPNGFHLRHRA